MHQACIGHAEMILVGMGHENPLQARQIQCIFGAGRPQIRSKINEIVLIQQQQHTAQTDVGRIFPGIGADRAAAERIGDHFRSTGSKKQHITPPS